MINAQHYPSDGSSSDSLIFCKDFDNHLRWQQGERLSDLFEQRCNELAQAGIIDHLAILTDSSRLSYKELDIAANRLAHYLSAQGIGEGDRVALLFDKSVEAYITLIATHKIGACFVPLDSSFPADRIVYMVEDAKVRAILTLSQFRKNLPDSMARLICLDTVVQEIQAQSPERLPRSSRSADSDPIAYIIYTSGSTGRPKGVAVKHSSICNFVRVAAELYGYRLEDRVYQGMTIAFDFSFEEIFVPLMAGATLVPGPSGTHLVQRDLWQFLHDHEVTAFCCVPTLLATIEDDLPALRLLLLSGEACPQDLVSRWHRADRTILNLYGPTEATVTSSWTLLKPSKPVTIGAPLPSYVMGILHENESRLLPLGEVGEVCIAGPGLAYGYLNREDLTNQKFITDFLQLPNNPSGRIYRTGDLGRINADGEIEYLGRIDTQVKLRGYRIELTEIESVLMEYPGIAQAVVTVHSPALGVNELVAYYTLHKNSGEVSHSDMAKVLRTRLPGYMVPAYLELLPEIPLLPSHKTDRKRLPPPKGPRLQAMIGEHVEAGTKTENELAAQLALVLNLDRVSTNAHFFNDLGAHSLLMAQFCAALRKHTGFTQISIRDTYLNPTIRELAAAIDTQVTARNTEKCTREVHNPSRSSYWICGSLQVLYYLGYASFLFWLSMVGAEWITQSSSLFESYLRTVGFAVTSSVGTILLPIFFKWLLIGRWKPGKIPIWSLQYLRFWVVKHLIQDNPMVLLRGTLLYNLYLNALGANISLKAVINSRYLPVCTDLISIGEETVLCKDSMLSGYTARGNYIYTGPVTIGARVYVGEATVIEIGSTLEDGCQLAHASLAGEGQILKSERRYHGTPAVETSGDFCLLPAMPCSLFRRAVYSMIKFCAHLALSIPGVLTAANFLSSFAEHLGSSSTSEIGRILSSPWEFLVPILSQSVAFFLALILGELTIVLVVPRLLRSQIKPDKTYPLFGFHDALREMLTLSSNSQLLHILFGDSSAIVHYLKAIGYQLNRVVQTGTNFGTLVQHDSPFLCDIGSGTMVSDGLSLNNLEQSGTSFRLSKVKIGAQCYLGNQIQFPPRAKMGQNCLLATRVLVPVHGALHENTGLLGSPSFKIPRVVERDRDVIASLSGEDCRKGLAAKNRYNMVTVLGLLVVYWVYFFSLLLFSDFSVRLYVEYGLIAWMVALLDYTIFTLAYFVIAERASLGFKRLEAGMFSIYDKRFWRVERNWKMSESILMSLFWGTPLRNFITRALGARIGRMVFDDGCMMPEKSMVNVGDGSNLNTMAAMQCHSLEEGVFKSGPIQLGRGCTLGTAAFVHYNVTMDDGVELEANSFLMKGEMPKSHSVWHGNPAHPVTLH